jgi:hypothetical protein
MVDMNALTKALAQVVLDHGYLHLGDFTLEEFLMQELGINKSTLVQLKEALSAIDNR